MRTYHRSDSAVFLKTREKFGGLSNMAGGFPLVVNGVDIRTSEALYQACRFPHKPDLQRLIIEQKSPMTAKMKGKPYRNESRSDWDEVRVKIMRWCLEVKLAQNWDAFREILLSTGNLPIVEHSRKDEFWGAKPLDDDSLRGVNALGRLLMELRERIKREPQESLLCVLALPLSNFLLYGKEIQEIDMRLQSSVTSASSQEAETTGGSEANYVLTVSSVATQPTPVLDAQLQRDGMHNADTSVVVPPKANKRQNNRKSSKRRSGMRDAKKKMALLI